MAVKHRYISNVDPKEADRLWQEFNQKRYYNPNKINAREGRDRDLKRTGYNTNTRPEYGNQYYNGAYKDENTDGLNKIKKSYSERTKNARDANGIIDKVLNRKKKTTR